MIEHLIISRVLYDDEYTRKVLPFLKAEYFQEKSTQIIIEHINSYFQKYNVVPSKQALLVDIDNSQVANESVFKQIASTIEAFELDTVTQLQWIIDQTEDFCKERALHNAIRQSISIMDKDSKIPVGAIPKLMEDALAVSFDTNVGHDFFMNLQERYEFYHLVEEKVPFDIDLLNTVTRGGCSRKTLTVLMAGTGGGKSLAMCHMAAANMRMGKNVLYITLEMSEERIAERIDANLLDTPIDDLMTLPWDTYNNRLTKIKEKTTGRLIIKEYPTSSAGASNFRYLITELKQKKNFIPDIIYIDYINICSSSRVKIGSNVNSYLYIKMIAEELRGLSVENNVPIITATQVNRVGYTDSDFGLENTSESFGLPATCDLMLGLISTDELAQLGQIMIKQLKNRYSDPDRKRRFVVGIDKPRMKLYNLEDSAQEDLVEDVAVMNTTTFGKRDEDDNKKFNKGKFSGFK
jgi:replicative DNA helicase